MNRIILFLAFLCAQLFAIAADTYTVKVGELVTLSIPSEWESRLWGIEKTFHWNIEDQTVLKIENQGFNYLSFGSSTCR